MRSGPDVPDTSSPRATSHPTSGGAPIDAATQRWRWVRVGPAGAEVRTDPGDRPAVDWCTGSPDDDDAGPPPLLVIEVLDGVDRAAIPLPMLVDGRIAPHVLLDRRRFPDEESIPLGARPPFAVVADHPATAAIHLAQGCGWVRAVRPWRTSESPDSGSGASGPVVIVAGTDDHSAEAILVHALDAADTGAGRPDLVVVGADPTANDLADRLRVAGSTVSGRFLRLHAAIEAVDPCLVVLLPGCGIQPDVALAAGVPVVSDRAPMLVDWPLVPTFHPRLVGVVDHVRIVDVFVDAALREWLAAAAVGQLRSSVTFGTEAGALDDAMQYVRGIADAVHRLGAPHLEWLTEADRAEQIQWLDAAGSGRPWWADR